MASARQEMIADFIEWQAQWRRGKSEEYPHDTRNERSARGLSELARYVRDLPEVDTRIIELTRVGFTEGADVWMPGQDASKTISQFRFHNATESCDDFLGQLRSIVIQSLLEDADEAGIL